MFMCYSIYCNIYTQVDVMSTYKREGTTIREMYSKLRNVFNKGLGSQSSSSVVIPFACVFSICTSFGILLFF